MFRKIYIDFIRERLKKGELRWLASRAKQYLLIQASAIAGRPFCGPILGTLVTNYRCNFRCLMCDLPLRDAELCEKGYEEMDTDGMKRLIREFRSLGVSGLGFTGGEPLLRKDIVELLAYTKQLGLITHLNTNGSLLDEKMAVSLIEARVDSINISLDGACPNTHDRIRGVHGAFDKTVRAIGIICGLRDRIGAPIRVKTVAVLQEENIGEVAELIALTGGLKVDCIEFIPRQTFRLDESHETEPSKDFLQKVDEVTELLVANSGFGSAIENSKTQLKLFSGSFRGEPSPLKCFAGYNSLAVDCYGEIYPCVPWYNWRKSAGNIREGSLEKFWYSMTYNQTRKELVHCRKCTLNCQAELNILFKPGYR
ncbi:MAG: radical SAM protein [Nitrospirae bacterium]|nr:radical SAM protein [Nitrospirota bacterium]